MNHVIEELTAFRAALQSISEMTDRLLAYCRTHVPAADTPSESAPDAPPPFETIYPLCMEPGFFKGKSAVAVIFPDGVRIETPTWKALAGVILKRCNDDAGKHTALMELRNRVQGRRRLMLGNGPAGMRSPIKIDRGLYMESHYDTESLLRIMKTRILDAVGYDYSGIQGSVRNTEQRP